MNLYGSGNTYLTPIKVRFVLINTENLRNKNISIMAGNIFDLTKQFDLSKIDVIELDILLLYEFQNTTSRLDITKFDEQIIKTIYNDEFYVTYNKEKIIKIETGLAPDNIKLQEICKKINEILIKKKGEQRIGTEVLFSNNPFISTYRYKDLFAIGEVPKVFPQPYQLAAPHPLILQYKYTATELAILNSHRTKKKISEILYLMSVFSDFSFDIYRLSDSGMGWVLRKKSNTSELRQVGYYCDYRKLNNIFKEKRVEVFPYAHHIDKYFDLNSALKEQFITACYWYYKASTASCTNDRYLHYITAIETLINRNEENNKENNPKELHEKILEEYREKRALPDTNYRELFDDFFTKYEKAVNTINTKGSTYQFKKFLENYAGINDNKLLNSMYYLRSNISHKGKTIDSMLIKALPNIEILQIVCKKSLINWFNEKSGAKLDKQISLSLEDLSKEYRSGQIEKGKKINEILFDKKRQFPWKTNPN